MKLTKGMYTLEDAMNMSAATIETIMDENIKELQEQEKRMKEQSTAEEIEYRKNASKERSIKSGSLTKADHTKQLQYFK